MNFELLLPEIIIAGTAVLVILLDLFDGRRAITIASLAGLVAAFCVTVSLWNGDWQLIFNNLFAFDGYAVFFKLLFIGICAMVMLASTVYASRGTRYDSEYHALLLMATLGMMLLSSASDLISVFISLELVTISCYVLVGLLKDRKSTEAALKYVLLGGISSAVLVYGMSLVFGFTGETQLAEISAVLQNISDTNPGLLMGMALMAAGFGFKIAAFPFQMWAPDVYEGAPVPVTLFLSVGSKAAGFAVLLRVFIMAFGASPVSSVFNPSVLMHYWSPLFAVLSAIGMLLGNILAIQQGNIKRMMAYSGIAHSGYMLIGLAAAGVSAAGQSNLLFYVTAFALADIAAFTVIIIVSDRLNSDLIEDYSGMGKRSPLLASALTLALVSLTGLPPAAGFIAKFYIFTAAAESGLLWLIIIAVLASVISAFYYLRVVRLMWLGKSVSNEKIGTSAMPGLALGIACAGILLLGIAPALMMKLVEAASILGF